MRPLLMLFCRAVPPSTRVAICLPSIRSQCCPSHRINEAHDRIVNDRVDIGAYEASYSSSPVNVSGRITTYSGRGIERTRIRIDDGQGNVFYTQTNPFGYYRLNNLIPGMTYTITVTHKLYLFTSPQFFTADQNRDDLNFMTGL